MFNKKLSKQTEQRQKKIQECHEALDRTRQNLLKFVKDNGIKYTPNKNNESC